MKTGCIQTHMRPLLCHCCRTPFWSERPRPKYCSPICAKQVDRCNARESQRRTRVPKLPHWCAWCGENLPPDRHPRVQYCDRTCRDAMNETRKKERRAAA